MLTVEEMTEQQLVLVEAAEGDDEGERPLHAVLQRERLHTRQGGHGLETVYGRRSGSIRPNPLRLDCIDMEKLSDEVKGHEAGTEVILIRV